MNLKEVQNSTGRSGHGEVLTVEISAREVWTVGIQTRGVWTLRFK